MNWTMPCTESRIGTATVAAALIAISGLIAPAHALATPTPFNAADYAIDASKLFNSAATDKPHNNDELSWGDYIDIDD
jgi:hypothetical protein